MVAFDMAPSAVLAVLKAGDRVEVDFTAAGALQHRLTATLLAVDQLGVAVREVRDTDQIDRFIPYSAIQSIARIGRDTD